MENVFFTNILYLNPQSTLSLYALQFPVPGEEEDKKKQLPIPPLGSVKPSKQVVSNNKHQVTSSADESSTNESKPAKAQKQKKCKYIFGKCTYMEPSESNFQSFSHEFLQTKIGNQHKLILSFIQLKHQIYCFLLWLTI